MIKIDGYKIEQLHDIAAALSLRPELADRVVELCKAISEAEQRCILDEVGATVAAHLHQCSNGSTLVDRVNKRRTIGVTLELSRQTAEMLFDYVRAHRRHN